MGFTVFLDRDGVLNQAVPVGVRWREEFAWLPGSLEALRLLNRPDVRTCLCTNQPLVGMGLLPQRRLTGIHAAMMDDLLKAGGRLDRIEVATGAPWSRDPRRKPRPGMLEDGARALEAQGWDFERERAVMVGDKLRDAQAAHAFGVPCLLLATSTPAERLATAAQRSGTPHAGIVGGLFDAAQWVAGRLEGRSDAVTPLVPSTMPGPAATAPSSAAPARQQA